MANARALGMLAALLAALPAGARAGCVQAALDAYCGKLYRGMVARFDEHRWACYSALQERLGLQCASDYEGFVNCPVHQPPPFFWLDGHHRELLNLQHDVARCNTAIRHDKPQPSMPPPPSSPPPSISPPTPPPPVILKPEFIEFAPSKHTAPDGMRLTSASSRFSIHTILDPYSRDLQHRTRVFWEYKWHGRMVRSNGARWQPPLDLSDRRISPAGNATSNLVISPFILVPGAEYLFKVEVGVPGASHASFTSVETHVRIDVPPARGTLEVAPTKGDELVTRFEFNAPGWVDTHLPLSYQFAYTLSPHAPPIDDMVLTEVQPSARAHAYLAAGHYFIVVRVFDGLGSFTRHVLHEEIAVGTRAFTDAELDGVLDMARQGSRETQQQLCLGLSEKLNAASPLPPPRGHEGPHPRERDSAELEKSGAVRTKVVNIIASAMPAPGARAAPISASAVGQHSATVASLCARPEELEAGAQVKAAQVVSHLAGEAKAGGISDQVTTGHSLVSSLSSLLSTNSSALQQHEHEAVSSTAREAARAVSAGLLHERVPGESPVFISSPQLSVSATRTVAHNLGKRRIESPGALGGGVQLPAHIVDPHDPNVANGVDVKFISFGRNVHKDPAAIARAELERTGGKSEAANEALRHQVATQVFAVELASAEHGHGLQVKGLAEPILLELFLGDDSHGQHSADKEALAQNEACVEAHMRAYADSMRHQWLWFNGTAVELMSDREVLIARALRNSATAAEAEARYGANATGAVSPHDDLPAGAEGEALRVARAYAEVLSVRQRVYELALACPQPAASSCQYWDEAHAKWSTEGCKALPRLPEYSYGLHLLDSNGGPEPREARVVRCECTHLTDFAGLSVPLTGEELLEQITAVHVNTFSFHDLGHAMTHFDYAQNSAIYDLVFLLAGANALFLAISCLWDWRAWRNRMSEHKAKVALAITDAAAAREKEEKRLLAAKALGGVPSAARHGSTRAASAWSQTSARAQLGKLLTDVRGEVRERIRDEHTLVAVFFSSDRSYSRAQLVQILFNLIAVELVVECMLYSAPTNTPAAIAAAHEAQAQELIAGGMEADAAHAFVDAQPPPGKPKTAIVTFLITSLITSSVCVPAMIVFKQLWFLYEVWPFRRCLRAPSRMDRDLAATHIQAVQRKRLARKERELREQAVGGAKAKTANSEQRLRDEIVKSTLEIRKLSAQVDDLLKLATQQRNSGLSGILADTLLRVEASQRQLAAERAKRSALAQQDEERKLEARALKRQASDARRLSAAGTLPQHRPPPSLPTGAAGAPVTPAAAVLPNGKPAGAAVESATLSSQSSETGGSSAGTPRKRLSLLSGGARLCSASTASGSAAVVKPTRVAGTAYARFDEEGAAPAAELTPEQRARRRKIKEAERKKERRRKRMERMAKAADRRWVNLPLIYFQVLAWICMWLCFAVCCTLIVTYGIVLGEEASSNMLTSWTLALGQTFIVHEPLLISVTAAAPLIIVTVLSALAAIPSFAALFDRASDWRDDVESFIAWLDYYFSEC